MNFNASDVRIGIRGKKEKNHGLCIYLVNIHIMRKIFFSNYVCFSKSPNFMQGMKKMADCSELILYKHTTALNYERRQDKHVFHNSSLFKDFCKCFCKDFLVEREIYVRSFIVLQGRRYTGGDGGRGLVYSS